MILVVNTVRFHTHVFFDVGDTLFVRTLTQFLGLQGAVHGPYLAEGATATVVRTGLPESSGVIAPDSLRLHKMTPGLHRRHLKTVPDGAPASAPAPQEMSHAPAPSNTTPFAAADVEHVGYSTDAGFLGCGSRTKDWALPPGQYTQIPLKGGFAYRPERSINVVMTEHSDTCCGLGKKSDQRTVRIDPNTALKDLPFRSTYIGTD